MAGAPYSLLKTKAVEVVRLLLLTVYPPQAKMSTNIMQINQKSLREMNAQQIAHLNHYANI